MISSVLYLFIGCEMQTQSHHVVGLLDGQEVYDLRIIRVMLVFWQDKDISNFIIGRKRPLPFHWEDISNPKLYLGQMRKSK